MLTPHRGSRDVAVEEFHNYYEQMVREEMGRQLAGQPLDANVLADIACVALNHLPPRYIRYDVDMSFYLSPKEREEMEQKVAAAVREAADFVRERGRQRSDGG
jgi:hypothetical protein